MTGETGAAVQHNLKRKVLADLAMANAKGVGEFYFFGFDLPSADRDFRATNGDAFKLHSRGHRPAAQGNMLRTEKGTATLLYKNRLRPGTT